MRSLTLPVVLAALVVPAQGVAQAASRPAQCNGSPSAPTADTQAPPPAELSPFAVLGRAATASDALPPLALQGLAGALRRYDPAYVRRLGAGPGTSGVFLVTGELVDQSLSIACAFPNGNAPAAIKRAVPQERALARLPAYCLVLATATAYSFLCNTFRALSGGYAFGELPSPTTGGAPGSPGGRDRIAGLVPDGVASVSLTYRGVAMTASVTGNCFTADPPAVPQALVNTIVTLQDRIRVVRGAPKPTPKQQRRLTQLRREAASYTTPSQVQWIGASGQLIERFTPPRTPPFQVSGDGAGGFGETLFGRGING